MVNLKLEPILQRALSLEGNQLAELVRNALDAPGIYTFSELLENPSVQKLHSTHGSIFSLLEIFAYGTLQDYKLNQHSLPSLTVRELQKLRLLTLISLVSNSRRILTYEFLQSTLEIPDLRTLEDLIIEGFYDNVLQGTLNQRLCELHVEWTLGRDVHRNQFPSILQSLREWAATTQTVLNHLDHAFENIKTIANDSKQFSVQRKEHLEYLATRNKGKRPASIDEFTAA